LFLICASVDLPFLFHRTEILSFPESAQKEHTENILFHMENKKLEDCHFFLSGHCAKGDGCDYRHKAAVKFQPICTQWLCGKCAEPNCPNRHPTLPRQKDGARTVCFYNQGCTKPECTFFHTGTVISPAAQQKPQDQTITPLASTTTQDAVAPLAQASAAAAGRRKKATTSSILDLPPRLEQRKTPSAAPPEPDSAVASKGTKKHSFVKPFEEIMKEKGLQPAAEKSQTQTKATTKVVPPETAEQAKKTVGGRGKGTRMPASQKPQPEHKSRSERITPTTETTPPSSKPNFGVKSLNELMLERKEKKPQEDAVGVKRPREESHSTAQATSPPKQKQTKTEPSGDPSSKTPQQVPENEDEDDLELDIAPGSMDEFIDDDELNTLLEE